MNKFKYRIQQPKDQYWIDENGIRVPVSRLAKSEKLAERKAGKLVKKALQLHDKLKAFKKEIFEDTEAVYRQMMEDLKVKIKDDYKGNFTWYNFDRSVKFTVDINRPIEFDEGIITAAKAKFDEFLDKNITAKNEFAKELILSAFETRKGKLDVKKILSLTKYEDKVNDPLFSEAVRLINKAIRHRKTKKYIKIYVRNADGKYEPVELNFSNIETDE